MSKPTAENLDKLRLARSEGIGPKRYQKLLSDYGSAAAALRHLAEKNTTTSGKKRKICTEAAARAETEQLLSKNGQFLFWGDDNYPPLLAELDDAPAVLSVIGDVSALHAPQVALVGNRDVSLHGAKFTHSLAKDLVQSGFAITSGLARGVDTAAHKGALNAQGQTVAVLGGGVDYIYPPENKRLYEEIIKRGGCVVSENPLGMVPTARHFPRRNRIISGLSYAVAVSEASRHSGSLITANYAGEHGREVFAVPGSPADPRAAGPNHLLKQGATLLQGAADILEKVSPRRAPALQPKVFYAREEVDALLDAPDNAVVSVENTAPATPKDKILSLLSSAPVAVDELIRYSGLSETDVMTTLTELDLEDAIVRQGDGRVLLKV